jgi:hypothetical protein
MDETNELADRVDARRSVRLSEAKNGFSWQTE